MCSPHNVKAPIQKTIKTRSYYEGILPSENSVHIRIEGHVFVKKRWPDIFHITYAKTERTYVEMFAPQVPNILSIFKCLDASSYTFQDISKCLFPWLHTFIIFQMFGHNCNFQMFGAVGQTCKICKCLDTAGEMFSRRCPIIWTGLKGLAEVWPRVLHGCCLGFPLMHLVALAFGSGSV